jgi:2-amino-4-hydroxy-6-hydroxymethyldihydropteridine diphosphokinase
MSNLTGPTGVSESKVFIGLGSNLGDRADKLERARAELGKLGRVLRCSSMFETTPWKVGTQPLYLNQVCQLETELPPAELMKKLLQVERRLGRKRLYRGEPRLIDIDMLLYGDQIIDTPKLKIPHPRMTDRAFVLAPLAEIAPGLRHPVLGEKIDELLSKADATGVKKLP